MAWLESRCCDHESEICFGNEVGQRKTVSPVASRHLGSEPEMTGDKYVCGIAIPLLLPAPCKLLLLIRLEHIVSPDGHQIGVDRWCPAERRGRVVTHDCVLSLHLSLPHLNAM